MSPRGRRSLGRRAFLAAGVGALSAPLAGCTRLSEFVADYYTGDVNVFNISDERLSCSLELAGPDGAVLLEESLDLNPDSEGEDDEPAAVYEGVLTDAGAHRLDVRADAVGSDRPTVSASETVHVDDPGAEKLVVIFSDEVGEEFLTVSLVEDFAELEDDLEGA